MNGNGFVGKFLVLFILAGLMLGLCILAGNYAAAGEWGLVAICVTVFLLDAIAGFTMMKGK